MCDSSDHDKGLQHDLEVMIARRQILKFAAGAGAAGLLTACDWGSGMSQAQDDKVATGADGATCVLHPAETAGPFPADGSNTAHGTLANVLADSGVKRRDIRFDLGQNSQPAPGATLELTVKVVNVSNNCSPLTGYAVYLWHCDADGQYSIYNVQARSYLRGVGVSDANGDIKFTTIIPGCYPGRYPHMHFEVYPSLKKATDFRNRILTSQLAIPAQTCRAVYASNAAYKESVEYFKYAPLERDGIFRDNTPKQLAAQTIDTSKAGDAAYNGVVTVGLEV